MILLCNFCGKEFEASRRDAKYCSDECRNKASRRNRGLIGKTCLICGNKFSPKTQSANKRQVCYDCIPDGETITRGRYIDLIKRKIYGGKCVRCGYNNCMAALEFHHLDPNEKDFSLSDRDLKLDWVLIKQELDKCILLCANCHRETHAQERKE